MDILAELNRNKTRKSSEPEWLIILLSIYQVIMLITQKDLILFYGYLWWSFVDIQLAFLNFHSSFYLTIHMGLFISWLKLNSDII